MPVMGDETLLAPLNKTFVVERKGGYPWGNGFANNNSYKQLPVVLRNNGDAEMVEMYVSDPISRITDRIESLTLRVQVYGALPDDEVNISLNGIPLTGKIQTGYADKQIRPLQPEYTSGYHTDWLPDREERFIRILCAVVPDMIARGRNYVSVSLNRALGYPYLAKAELERVELAVVYKKDSQDKHPSGGDNHVSPRNP